MLLRTLRHHLLSLHHSLLLSQMRHMIPSSQIHPILPHHPLILLMTLRIEVFVPERLIPKSRHPQIKVLLKVDMHLRTRRLLVISALPAP